jgi:hypothetical protein
MVRFSGVRRSAAVALIGVLVLLGSLVLMESMASADNAGCGRQEADYGGGRTYHGFATTPPYTASEPTSKLYPLKVVFRNGGQVTVTMPISDLLGNPPSLRELDGTYTVEDGTVSWTVSSPAENDIPRTFTSRDRGCDNSTAVPRSIGGVTSASGEEGIRGVFTLYRQS